MSHDSRRWTGRYPVAPAVPREPRRRRWLPWLLAAVMLLALVLAGVQSVAPSGSDDWTALTWSVAAGGIGAAIGWSPFARGPLVLARTDAYGYDEFERAALSRASARAYAAIVLLLVAVCGLGAWASAHGWAGPRSPADWLAWALALLVVGTNLPVFIAEITVPFPPTREEEQP